jgi:hypothetical protein
VNPERWARIKEIYHSALEIEPGRREAYLEEACSGDDALYTEVACLLPDKGNSEELFDSPSRERLQKTTRTSHDQT